MGDYQTRVYKYSIGLLFYRQYGDSRPFKVKPGFRALLPGLPYSFITIVCGFWSIFGRHDALRALGINFAGGLDYTKEFAELEYDDVVVYVYNNLPRNTFLKTRLEDVEILIELQNEYHTSEEYKSFENIDFLRTRLRKIGITNLDAADLKAFCSAWNNIHKQENPS